MNNKKILILAGEASGDELAAKLSKQLLQINPNYQISGMGGEKLRAANVNILVDSTALAIIGFSEVIAHFKTLRRAFHLLKKFILENKPDLVILVDYPGFNLRIAKVAKDAGVKTLFYVSPQIWAWRYGRIEHIRKYIDKMLVLFPFEEH